MSGVALVTGASSGIGEVFARKLSGMDISCCWLRAAKSVWKGWRRNCKTQMC